MEKNRVPFKLGGDSNRLTLEYIDDGLQRTCCLYMEKLE